MIHTSRRRSTRTFVASVLLSQLIPGCGDDNGTASGPDAGGEPAYDVVGDTVSDTDRPRARDVGAPLADAATDDCEYGALAPGVCRPEPPRGTPASACPSGERTAEGAFQLGLCLPAPPQPTPADACPSGVWTAWDDGDGGVCAPLLPVLGTWTGPPTWAVTDAWEVDADNPPSDELPAWSFARPVIDADCDLRPTLDGTCVAVGSPCPADTFPTDESVRARIGAPDAALVFVAVGVAEGGDGSRERPWSDLSVAVDDAPDGAVVVLDGVAAPAGLALSRGVSLVGSCSDRAGLTFAGTAGLSIDGPSRVADLHIAGAEDTVAIDVVAGEGHVDGVRIDRADVAVNVGSGALFAGNDLVVTDVRIGIAAAASDVRLADIAIREVRGVAIDAREASQLTLRDVLVDQGGDSTRPESGGIVIDGGNASLERVAVRGFMRGIDVVGVASFSLFDGWLTGLGGLSGDTSAWGLIARDSAVTLERVATDGWFGPALDVEGGELSVNQLAALPGRTRSDSVTPRPTASIRIGRDTEFVASQVTVNGAYGSAIQINGASGSLTDAVVFDSRFAGRAHAAMTRTGRAIETLGGADLDLGRIYIERGYAQLIDLRASDVRVRDVTVRDGIQLRAGEGIPVFEDDAIVLRAWDGSTAVIERLDADRVTPGGVVAESSADVTLRDAVLRGTDYEGVPLGFGVSAALGTLDDFGQGEAPTFRVERSLIEGYQNGALIGDGGPSLTDVVIRGDAGIVDDDIDYTKLVGVYVGGEGTLTRVRIEDRAEAGVLVSGGRLFADDLDILRTNGLPAGQGLALSEGVARVVRGRVSGSALHGVVTTNRSSLTATDLVVEGNEGRGIAVQRDTIANIERAFVTSNDGIGVYVADNGRATLTDVVVTRTQLLACAATSCADAGEGFGIAVFDASTLQLLRVLIDGNATIGLAVDREGEVTAAQGVVSNQLIGVNITAPGFDAATAFDNVRTFANQVDLSARDLPVPSLVEDIEADATDTPP